MGGTVANGVCLASCRSTEEPSWIFCTGSWNHLGNYEPRLALSLQKWTTKRHHLPITAISKNIIKRQMEDSTANWYILLEIVPWVVQKSYESSDARSTFGAMVPGWTTAPKSCPGDTTHHRQLPLLQALHTHPKVQFFAGGNHQQLVAAENFLVAGGPGFYT